MVLQGHLPRFAEALRWENHSIRDGTGAGYLGQVFEEVYADCGAGGPSLPGPVAELSGDDKLEHGARHVNASRPP